MSSKILWKLIASALFLAYALHHLFPIESTPFEEAIQAQVSANQDGFKALLTEARERVATDSAAATAKGETSQTTIYSALYDIGAGKGKSGKTVDLQKEFFPDLRVVTDPNIARRNSYLLRDILQRAQGKLKLGLDLEGGVSFTLRVDPKNFEVNAEELEKMRSDAIRDATKGLRNPNDPALANPQEKEAATKKWNEAIATATQTAEKNASDTTESAKDRIKQALERAIAVMETRVNSLGVSEPLIRVVGDYSIEIQLAGENAANNPEILNTLKKPARLEFKLVHRYETPAPGTPEHRIVLLRENPADEASPMTNYEVLYLRDEDRQTGIIRETPLYVKRKADASGNIIKRASARQGQPEEDSPFHTVMEFTSDGARKFGRLTGVIAEKNNEELDLHGALRTSGRLAIVLDGKLVQAPGVSPMNSRLRPDKNTNRFHALDSGSASIGAQTLKEAQDLANVLNNPLEFPLTLQDSKQIGASLAKDAKEKSINASAVGIGLILVFMLVYYLWAGLISVVGLVLNVVLMLGLMAAFEARITLPGVAALVLTIGMAVDANILIFERIREELSMGKPFKAAVHSGYDRAQATILDVNLTSLMSAAILIYMGTGPVRGFGIILAIGLITTVFTSLVTCRALQEFCVEKNILNRIFGLNLFKGNTRYQFLNVAKPAFAISWMLAVASIAAIAVRGSDAFSKDFKGGEAAVVKIVPGSTQLDAGEIQKIAATAGVADVTATYQSALSGSNEVTLRIETELSSGKKTDAGTPLPDFTQVNKAIQAVRDKHPGHFPQGKLDEVVVGRESIGGAVSENLQRNALLSIFFALLGIAIYVALRFEAGMGLGAFISSLHDVLLTSGLYILAGKQFSISMIAAILMVIGYSINDTIVVFDRIREEMKRNPGMSLRDVIHLSINRTLSRTVLTSATIFLSALALWLLGAGDVQEYGLIFVLGVVTGTFSSIYIASPIFYWWHKGQRDSVERAEAQVRYSWEAGSEKAK